MENSRGKQQRLYSFIENIDHISDETYQERVWVRNEGPECEDIDDALCDFFDDGDPILQEYKDFEITEIQYESLVYLRKELDDFIDKYEVFSPEMSVENLIKLPQWKVIIGLAKNVLKKFGYTKK